MITEILNIAPKIFLIVMGVIAVAFALAALWAIFKKMIVNKIDMDIVENKINEAIELAKKENDLETAMILLTLQGARKMGTLNRMVDYCTKHSEEDLNMIMIRKRRDN